jgi:cell division protein FtsI/penicillin-binding protein 2
MLQQTDAPSRKGISRRTLMGATAAFALTNMQAIAAPIAREQRALEDALRGIPSTATVLDQRTGKVLARYGTERASSPGSILKPLLLFKALEQNLVTPATTVFCRRDLRIDGRPYPCTHPQSNIAFNAQEALAYSCNTWFASLALRFPALMLMEALRGFHLYPSREVETPQQRQLLMLGLAGIRIDTLRAAEAYRRLVIELNRPYARAVADGLRDSVAFGMAHNADVAGIEISGKTGTAEDLPHETWSHGWFAGFATVRGTPLLASISIAHGNGANAALLARSFFTACEKTTT